MMITGFLEGFAKTVGRVISDIGGTVSYLNVGIVVAIIYVALYVSYVFVCLIIGRDRRYRKGHATSVFLLLIYVTTLLYLVFMSREVDQYEGVNLILFSTWGRTYVTRALFIENIIMFIPMGMLLPSAFKKMRAFSRCILICFLLSFFIETTQFVFGIGIFELDDILTNTTGGIVGWLIWRSFYGFMRLFTKDTENMRLK